MLRALVDKVDLMQEKKGRVSRDGHLRKEHKEMLEIRKHTKGNEEYL